MQTTVHCVLCMYIPVHYTIFIQQKGSNYLSYYVLVYSTLMAYLYTTKNNFSSNKAKMWPNIHRSNRFPFFFSFIKHVRLQVQYLFMYEPDWGFWKCLVLFWVSGVTGNIVSASANPCSITVGSSGGLFGLMGGIIPYCFGK